MLVSGEVRLRLTDTDNRLALLVRGNELRRSGKRVLIPFGGGLRDPLEGFDLRFSVSPAQLEEARRRFESFSRDYIRKEAAREFREEACDERRILSASQAAACEYCYIRRIDFEGVSVRHSSLGQPMHYLIGVVEVRPSQKVLDTLLEISEEQASPLEFVSPELLEAGGVTEKGSMVPTLYSYLL